MQKTIRVGGLIAAITLVALVGGAGAKTWRAYLSTQAVGGATAVNGKDRIGSGPWVNAKGVPIPSSPRTAG